MAHGFGFERVGIVRYVPETGTLVPFAAHGLTPGEFSGSLPSSLPIGTFGAFDRALSSGRPAYAADPTTEAVPLAIITGFGLGSFVIVPLFSEGRCLGFMTCDERGERFDLDEAELDLLGTFGTLIAAFLERRSRTASSGA